MKQIPSKSGSSVKTLNCKSRIGESNRKRVKTEPITCLPIVGRRVIGSASMRLALILYNRFNMDPYSHRKKRTARTVQSAVTPTITYFLNMVSRPPHKTHRMKLQSSESRRSCFSEPQVIAYTQNHIYPDKASHISGKAKHPSG